MLPEVVRGPPLKVSNVAQTLSCGYPARKYRLDPTFFIVRRTMSRASSLGRLVSCRFSITSAGRAGRRPASRVRAGSSAPCEEGGEPRWWASGREGGGGGGRGGQRVRSGRGGGRGGRGGLPGGLHGDQSVGWWVRRECDQQQ